MIPVVLGIFLTGQAIADYVLSPYLIASRVRLNPVWIMFAIAAFGYLFGFVGLLIAVPLAAAIGVVIRFAMRQYLVSQLEPTAAPMTVVSAPEPSGKKTSFWRRWRERA
jgi:predicted PurR-regulated permease PerM